MFKDNDSFVNHPDHFEPVTTTIAAATGVVKLVGSIFGKKGQFTQGVVDAAKQLAISRDTAWASGDPAKVTAHNQLVISVDAQWDNIKHEKITLNDRRLGNFMITDRSGLWVGIPPRPGSNNPSDWTSSSFSWVPFDQNNVGASGLNAPIAGNVNSLEKSSGSDGLFTSTGSKYVYFGIGAVVLLLIVVLLLRR